MEKNFNIPEMTIKDFAKALFRHKIVIISTVFVIMAGTFIGLKMQTPVYEARVKMYIKGVSQTEALTYQTMSATRIHLTQMEIVRSEPVIKRAVTTLKLDERPFNYEKNFSSEIKKPFIDYFARKEMVALDELGPDM